MQAAATPVCAARDSDGCASRRSASPFGGHFIAFAAQLGRRCVAGTRTLLLSNLARRRRHHAQENLPRTADAGGMAQAAGGSALPAGGARAVRSPGLVAQLRQETLPPRPH